MINEVKLTSFLKIFKIKKISSLTEFFLDKQFRTLDTPDCFLDTSLTSKTMGLKVFLSGATKWLCGLKTKTIWKYYILISTVSHLCSVVWILITVKLTVSLLTQHFCWLKLNSKIMKCFWWTTSQLTLLIPHITNLTFSCLFCQKFFFHKYSPEKWSE